ncbi:sensor domain-containing phosphodiesterase [Chenggangzhangella methanolivorans]|uniref:EAL domain-containing protein n=1 Tax=Chenggangzhangella methanolivorans TaxID=1437009 RepID=A0A9E6RA24_9HYPH|nr:EAL domain-containing protein [Chenggangzhangella methanolivorans]QZO00914.1 EAL domain-containing protein [Chenggangzhangella methanolivorans]
MGSSRSKPIPQGSPGGVSIKVSEALADHAGVAAIGTDDPIGRALESVRRHLRMDVASISEFAGAAKTFRYVRSRAGRAPIWAGLSVPIADGYCKKVVDGLLPGLIVDASRHPAAREIPATRAVPIGSHLSVPLVLADGRVYGTLCCFSFAPDVTLNERDLALLAAFADVLACQIETQLVALRSRDELIDRLAAAMLRQEPAIVYQPIFKMFDMSIAGAEALARFGLEPRRAPDVWFAEAGALDMRTALEKQAIRNAIDGCREIWTASPIDLSVNCSPQTIVEGDLAAFFRHDPCERLILEITEHDHVAEYGPLLAALEPLRRMGVRVAVDDAGSGYASMRHIVHVAPDYIKLDLTLTRGIEEDRTRQALASSLIEFGHQTNCKIVAEGVETAAELLTLRNLGVDKAQGYFLSRPIQAEHVVDFARGAVSTLAGRVAWEGADLGTPPTALRA